VLDDPAVLAPSDRRCCRPDKVRADIAYDARHCRAFGLFPQTDEGDTTMADRPRMTAAHLVDKLLASEHADVLRESNAHAGLKAAIAQVLGCPWQRCTVHFLRDMLGHVSRAQQPLVSGAIRGIFTAATAAEARQRLGQIVDSCACTPPRSRRCWRTPKPTC
jgi:hypothetical protein